MRHTFTGRGGVTDEELGFKIIDLSRSYIFGKTVMWLKSRHLERLIRKMRLRAGRGRKSK